MKILHLAFNGFPNLKNDLFLMTKFVQASASNFLHTSDELKGNFDLAMEAVKSNPFFISLCSDALKENLELAEIVVSKNGKMLFHFGDDVRGNYDIAMIAVKNNGMALQWVSNYIIDKNLVIEAMKQNIHALSLINIPLGIRDDEEIIRMASENGLSNFAKITNSFQDLNSVKRYIDSHENSLQYLPIEMKKNIEIVEYCVKKDPISLRFAFPDLQCNKNLVLLAIEKNPSYYEHLHQNMKEDREILKAAVQKNGKMLKFANFKFLNDKEIVLMAVTQNGEIFPSVSYALRSDIDVALQAIQKDVHLINFASPSVRYDRRVLLETVKLGLNIELSNWNELKQDKEIYWFYLKRNQLIRNIPLTNINFKFKRYFE
jgi:hypothetical protein